MFWVVLFIKKTSWNAKCPIFFGNFTPKTRKSRKIIALKLGYLAFQVVFFSIWTVFCDSHPPTKANNGGSDKPTACGAFHVTLHKAGALRQLAWEENQIQPTSWNEKNLVNIYIYIYPGTLNNQFFMDVWGNNHFSNKDLESSN